MQNLIKNTLFLFTTTSYYIILISSIVKSSKHYFLRIKNWNLWNFFLIKLLR